MRKKITASMLNQSVSQVPVKAKTSKDPNYNAIKDSPIVPSAIG